VNAQGVFALTTPGTCHDLFQAAWSTKYLMNDRLQNKRALDYCGSRGIGAAELVCARTAVNGEFFISLIL